MNKSGGSAVKQMMEPWILAHINSKRAARVYDSRHWKTGLHHAKMYTRTDVTLTWGAYTEGLRSYGAQQDCKWFTMFRQ